MLLNQEQLSKLNEMVTFVALSRKGAIAFVLCNEPVLRKELYKKLEKRFESSNTNIITIELNENSDLLVNELRKKLPLKEKSVFCVYGIEKVSKATINSGKSSYLKSLNIMRDEFSTINHPVIIWSNECTLNKFANEAPDFWSWRTTVFVFRMEKSSKFLENTEKKLIESGLENLTLDELNTRYQWYMNLMEDYKTKGIADDYKFADWYFKLGMIHYLRGEYQEALDMYGKSMEIDRQIDDQHGIAYLLHSIAMIHQDKGEYHEALDKYRQALNIEENLGDQLGIASTTHNIAILQEDKDENIRREEAESLCTAFPHIPDIKQGCNDLHRFVQDSDENVRRKAAEAIGNGFSYILDKEQAWDDLHRLSLDKEYYVRSGAAKGLGVAFPHIPDKKQAWDDLHNLMHDKNESVRRQAADALGTAFPHIPYKEQAWNDLHQLTQDNEVYMRRCAAEGLDTAFPYILHKEQAWKDLHSLTNDNDGYVRWGAANAVGSAFHLIPNKEQAWSDLHRLVHDIEDYVRKGAVDAIGIAFPHLPKKQAMEELIHYSQDKDSDMRVSANYSLGRASIFKAAEAESKEEFRKGLENAINFFKNSSEEATYFNPAQFCLPFYRSFYAIIFKKENAESEVQKYLAEAKNAVKNSESKEKLLEAVDDLGNALKEVQKTRDFNELKSDLHSYRPYCERARKLLETTEEKAPSASRLIRKGLPIIDERIKGVLAEILEKAKALCKETRGTAFESLGIDVINTGQNFLNIRDPMGLEKQVQNMLFVLSSICAYMPKEESNDALEILKKINDEHYIEDKLSSINMVLSKIPIKIRKAGVMTKTEINNSTNIQVALGNANIPKIGTSTIPKYGLDEQGKPRKKTLKKSSISIDEKIQQKNASIEKILDNWGFRPGDFSQGEREERKADIEKWLRRFLPSEFEDAFLILERIQYYDSHAIGKCMEGLSGELKTIFDNDLSEILFYPLGESPASSEGNLLYSYRKDLGLPESSFPYVPLKDIDLSGKKAIVFFDDIIGSGNQAVRFAEKHLNDIKIDKYYIALIAFEKGIEKVRNNGCFKKVIVYEIISEELRAFSPNSQVFPDADTRERIKRLCEKYGKLLYPEHPLGYDDSQALIVFPHNTPNNTLPIIWASNKNEKEPGYVWYPIWERKGKRTIAQVLLKIAESHQSKGEYDEALEKYDQSMEILQQLGDQRGIAYTSAQLGLLYFYMGNKEEAVKFSQKALEIFEKIGLEKEAKDARSLIEKISTI